jgi:hypothetical protein
MITTNETEDELRGKGWVPLWGIDTRTLEAAGVPMKLAPSPPESGSGVWTTVAMAPRWAVVLVADWTLATEFLSRVVREVYRHPDEKQTELAEATLSAARLGGWNAVSALLSQAEKDRRT